MLQQSAWAGAAEKLAKDADRTEASLGPAGEKRAARNALWRRCCSTHHAAIIHALQRGLAPKQRPGSSIATQRAQKLAAGCARSAAGGTELLTSFAAPRSRCVYCATVRKVVIGFAHVLPLLKSRKPPPLVSLQLLAVSPLKLHFLSPSTALSKKLSEITLPQ